MAGVKSRHLEISAADSSTPVSRTEFLTRHTAKRNISPPSSLLSGSTPDSEDYSFGLEFVDDDLDSNFSPLISKKKRTEDVPARQVRRTRKKDHTKAEDVPARQVRRTRKKDHTKAGLDCVSLDKGECDELDSETSEDAQATMGIETLLEKLHETNTLGTEDEGGVGWEDAENPSPPKKWNHFLIPLEGALKHLPFYPFKKLWHKLYEDPGFEVSTNGECLLYNGKDQRSGFLKSIRYVHPVNKKYIATSLQKVILMLACGCAELPPEMHGNTICFNTRCIAIEHISLEPPYMRYDRWACFERGRCNRHYDPDEHRYFPDCRIDLTSKGSRGQQNVDMEEVECEAMDGDDVSDISLSESEVGS